MFIFPHGIYVDKDGNVWVTDGQGKDGKGHQVFKFSPDGKVLLTLGKPGVAGDGPDTFNKPNDVVVAPNGNIFVSDVHDAGMGNPRVVKLTKEGKFIKQWGGLGSGPGQFDVPHALAFDSQGRLFVGDRNNNRIQIFDQDGQLHRGVGRSSAAPAESISIATISSTSPIPSRLTAKATVTIPAGSEAFASAARRTAS